MKKVFIFLLALVLLCSMTAAALAVSDNEQTITTTVPDKTPSWSLVIPADITIPYGQEVTEFPQPTITDVQNAYEGSIVIAVKHSGQLTCGEKTLPFTLKQGNEVVQPTDSASGTPIGRSSSLQLIITQDAWDNAEAGTYTTTLTYTSFRIIVNI